MKNIYSAPEFKLILLEAQNVLETSGDVSDPGGDDIFDF